MARAVDPLGAAAGISLLQGRRQGIILIVIFGHADFAEIMIQCFFNGEVWQQFRCAVNEGALIFRPGHEGGAFRDIVHPRLQTDGIGHLVGANHIEHRGSRLYHVRRYAS